MLGTKMQVLKKMTAMQVHHRKNGLKYHTNKPKYFKLTARKIKNKGFRLIS